MKNKKKLLSIIMMLILAAGFTACGRASTENNQDYHSESEQEDISQTSSVNDKEAVAGMILDCNSTENLTLTSYNSDFGITHGNGEYKEGTGAFYSTGKNGMWWQVIMEETADISDYSDGGIQFWLYISDVAKLTLDATVVIGSAGNGSENTCQWKMSTDVLADGWNEVVLGFDKATDSSDGGADLTHVNFFRIYTGTNDGVTVRLDDVRAVEVEKISIQMVSCDSTAGFTVTCGKNTFSLTTEDRERKEGSASYKVSGQNTLSVGIRAEQEINISAAEEGTLHFWLWISDVTALSQDISVELGSGGTYDKEELQWKLSKSSLTIGWNEISLPINAAQFSTGGSINLGRVNWFRVFSLNADNIVMIVDDVSAIYY